MSSGKIYSYYSYVLDVNEMQLLINSLLHARIHTHSVQEESVWNLFNNYKVPLSLASVRLLIKSFILSKQAEYATYVYYLVTKQRIAISTKHLNKFDPILSTLLSDVDVDDSSSLASYSIHWMLRHDMNANCITSMLSDVSIDNVLGQRTYAAAIKHYASLSLWRESFTALKILHDRTILDNIMLINIHEHLFKTLGFNPSPRNSELARELFSEIERLHPDTMTLVCWKFFFGLQPYDVIINYFYTYILTDEYKGYESERLGEVLTMTVKRLCKEFQSAWALRSLVDWMEWNEM